MTIKIYNHELAKSIGDRAAILYEYIVRRFDAVGQFRHHNWFGHSIGQFCQEFPYYSEGTIKRHLKELKDLGLISVREGNSFSKCANSYRPNYHVAENLINEKQDQNDLGGDQNDPKVGSKRSGSQIKMIRRSDQNDLPTISYNNQYNIIQDRAREAAPLDLNINIELLPEDMREQVRAKIERIKANERNKENIAGRN